MVVMAMMTPSIVVAAAPAPSVMMTASAVVAHMAVSATMTALDLDERIVLYRQRACGRRAQPGRGGKRHEQCRRQRRGSNQQSAFHLISSSRGTATNATISRNWNGSREGEAS
jgi:hypothetical protein